MSPPAWRGSCTGAVRGVLAKGPPGCAVRGGAGLGPRCLPPALPSPTASTLPPRRARRRGGAVWQPDVRVVEPSGPAPSCPGSGGACRAVASCHGTPAGRRGPTHGASSSFGRGVRQGNLVGAARGRPSGRLRRMRLWKGSPGEPQARPIGNGGIACWTPRRIKASKPAHPRVGNGRGARAHGDVGPAAAGGQALEGRHGGGGDEAARARARPVPETP